MTKLLLHNLGDLCTNGAILCILFGYIPKKHYLCTRFFRIYIINNILWH